VVNTIDAISTLDVHVLSAPKIKTRHSSKARDKLPRWLTTSGVDDRPTSKIVSIRYSVIMVSTVN
jgi:hypothetical protein